MATEPPDPNPARPAPQLFLLRLWRTARGFRAALRPIGSGEPHLFSEPGALGDYLRRAGQDLPSPDTDPSSPPVADRGDTR